MALSSRTPDEPWCGWFVESFTVKGAGARAAPAREHVLVGISGSKHCHRPFVGMLRSSTWTGQLERAAPVIRDKEESLCGIGGCRRERGHSARGHDARPAEAWGFLSKRDKDKLTKAGFATPRGGNKGAYQNHVLRTNRVIIPYERLGDIDLTGFGDGYTIRLFPHQYFSELCKPKAEFLESSEVEVGRNAFVLYRSHESLELYPPMPNWIVSRLIKDGNEVTTRREGVDDDGHYVLRIPRLGSKLRVNKGRPQGIFAPEYADRDDNYLSKCVLALLIIRSSGSPYTTTQARHLQRIVTMASIDSEEYFENIGAIRRGMSCCPLCLKFIRYSELHDVVSFDGEDAVGNASSQLADTTRSTIVNLFHLDPLVYGSTGQHHPTNVAWGHATCNTHLGQRRCYSLRELQDGGLKVGVIHEEGIDTFGWISDNGQMIRSPDGAVWIQIQGDEMNENVDEDREEDSA